jgi:hypothetical protein
LTLLAEGLTIRARRAFSVSRVAMVSRFFAARLAERD